MSAANAYLPFFRAHPEGIQNKPPLISSLQAVETMLFLIALGRLPAALMICGQAVESGIKAGLGISPVDRVNWKKLTTLAAQHVAPHLGSGITDDSLKDFRDVRNEFSHYGFSPDDDVRSAEQILETGLPYLEDIYLSFFKFDLADSLVHEHVDAYSIAKQAYAGGSFRQLGIAPSAFTVLTQSVRNRWQPTFTGQAEDQLLMSAREDSSIHDHIDDVKKSIEKELDFNTTQFDCPVCAGELGTVVAELDMEAIDSGKLSLLQAICVECGLHIRGGIPLLADLTFASQIREIEPRILSEFGVD